MDHPGALRHPADHEPLAVRDGLLRAGVGGQDRLCRGRPAVRREPVDRGAEAAEQLVDRQRHADHAGREHEHLLLREPEQPCGRRRGRLRVAHALLAGRRVRVPRVDDHRLRLRVLEVLLRENDGRRLHAVDREHRRTGRGSGRANEREVVPRLADPAVHAAGDEALRSRDAHTRHPLQPKPGGLLEAEREVRVLDGLARRALAEVVERADHDRLAGRAVLEHAELCGVRLLHARELRRDAFGEQVHDARAGVRLLEPRAHRVRVGGRVTGDDQPAAHRQQVRHEAHGEAEHLLDLGCVLVRPHAVRGDVLEHEARVRRLLQPAPRARHAGLGVDHDARRFEEVGHRDEREQRRRRVAPGVRDQRPGRRRQLGHRVAPLRERVGVRVLEAVPLRVEAGVCQAVRAGEIDDDGVVRNVERRGLLVPEAGEDDVRAGLERRLVRHERREVTVQPHVEGRGGAARRASPSRARAAPARGAPAGGRASPGRRTRRRRGWQRSASA